MSSAVTNIVVDPGKPPAAVTTSFAFPVSCTVAVTVGTSVVPANNSTSYVNTDGLKPVTVVPFTVKSLSVASTSFIEAGTIAKL